MEAFVLDLAILPAYAAAPVLRDLFRSPTTVKVGFNAAADLKAIARALGGAGAATVARTEPFVEVGAVNRFLRVRGAPGVSPVARRGLSGLVEAQLGLPLDKSLQCSQWDARPLSADQIRYAAADAVVLLELVSSYAAQAAPRKFCMRTYLQKQLEKSGTAISCFNCFSVAFSFTFVPRRPILQCRTSIACLHTHVPSPL